MKNVYSIYLLALMSLVLVGCSESKTTSSSSSNSSSYTCNSTNNSTLPGCPGYCTTNPTSVYCSGSGTTTGSTTGGNPYPNYPSSSLYPNWGVRYPGGVPTGTCSTPTAPSGITYTPYETRVATVTASGLNAHNPSETITQNALNTSVSLMSVAEAIKFYGSDGVLKVRFKANKQPDLAKGSTICAGRASGQSTTPGYTKLIINLKVVGKLYINGVLTTETVSIPVDTLAVNNCSAAINLKTYLDRYTEGMYLTISEVMANQNCWWDDSASGTGFTNCTSFKKVRDADCWSVDIEVAADGTKTFN